MIEDTILAGLVHNDEYARKVIPFLKEEYFDDFNEKEVFNQIQKYITKYNGLPTAEALGIAIGKIDTLNDDQYTGMIALVNNLKYDSKTDIDWIVDETEKFCQDRSIYNAVRQAILVLDGKVKDRDRGSIPDLLSTALGVSFDSNIGHDFIEDSLSRYDFYHHLEERVPFDLEYFNRITKGGLPNKSLSVCLAGTGVGKTMFMTHCAAANLMQGKRVLYITNEMAEERIAERIDANLMDITIDELGQIPKQDFISRMDRIKARTTGNLLIKEYPTASAGAAHFRHLLNELKLKKKFKPDIIYIDYLNICVSSRLKMGSNVNSYTYIKAIAEELRGLAVEFKLPIMTATQTTRSGFSNSDVGLEDTSESFGLPATADFMFALVSTEELEELGQLMVKQLKNRWGAIDNPRRFVIGVERAKMKLYDTEQTSQDDLMEDKSVMDDTKFGERQYEDERKGVFGKFKKDTSEWT
ncbi:MAG: DNA primase [Robiginitomaculum sp.]|nr:MAG: DNA primase [Robiginitomaculum sp.]